MAKHQETPFCHHVMANGTLCQSPCLRDQPYCYFHFSVRRRTRRIRRAQRLKLPLQLPVLEDSNTIQLAIGDTLNALLAGQLDPKTASLLLRGLRTAQQNLKELGFRSYNSDARFLEFNPEEDALLEAEIAQDIAEEEAAGQAVEPQPAPASPSSKAPDSPGLPPKKSPAPSEASPRTTTAEPILRAANDSVEHNR